MSTANASPPAQVDAAETERSGRFGSFMKKQIQQSLAFATLVVMFIFFAIFAPNFMSWQNVSGILMAVAVIGILALGTTFVIITAGIDLSIGTGMTLCAVMTGVFITNWGFPMWLGILGGLAMGALIGLVNGIGVVYLRLAPFIATLAMMMIAQGLALVISGVKPIYFSTSAPSFKQLALGTLIPGLPNAVLITIVVAIIAWVVLGKTVLGRYTFALGSNLEATRLSGVNTKRWLLTVYIFAGLFTGLAGVIMAARLDSAQPQLGVGYELQAIAAVVIGGTSLFGGRGSIVGTIIGALIMGTLINGLRVMSIQTEWQNVVLGIVIIIAVFFDSLRNRTST